MTFIKLTKVTNESFPRGGFREGIKWPPKVILAIGALSGVVAMLTIEPVNDMIVSFAINYDEEGVTYCKIKKDQNNYFNSICLIMSNLFYIYFYLMKFNFIYILNKSKKTNTDRNMIWTLIANPVFNLHKMIIP